MPTETWTIKRVLDWTIGYLGRKGDERPRLSAEWLLCYVTGLSRVEVYTNFDKPLTQQELAAMHDAVARRGRGEPLQYVTGEMPFRHIIMRCEEGVLIPRPETEVLVDDCLEALRGLEAPRVLEVGTGTGCIALSLATEHPGTRVIATDISPRAVTLAMRNRDALNLAGVVDVVESDLAAAVPEQLMGTFDLLVSNPPYIPSLVLEYEVQPEVKDHEPHLALDGGPDGLDVFRRLLALAPIALRPGGTMALELFEGNVDAAAQLCRQQGGWSRVEVHQDLTHRPRVLVATRADVPDKGGRLKIAQSQCAGPAFDKAVATLARGGVLVMPTDSVYGIGCAATPDNPGHERIFDIKQRARSQTLPWLVADPADLARYGTDVPAYVDKLAKRWWPGALTLVVRASDAVPSEYRADDGTIALRCPDSPLVRALARAVGVPLATTSANTHGEAAAASGEAIEPRIVAEADLTLDAGPAPVGVASTIVGCCGAHPQVFREGAIAASEIADVADVS